MKEFDFFKKLTQDEQKYLLENSKLLFDKKNFDSFKE